MPVRPFIVRTLALLLIVAGLGSFAESANAETRLLRFPDLHGDQIVFTYAGDLWLASTDGGAARRLTAHPGLELFAKFSPDGQHVAFTGQYDGDEQVYVVPTAGGEPRQLTFYPAIGPLPPRWGYDNQVYGWSPDGGKVLFRSLRDGWDLSDSRLHLVSADGGLPEVLPMPFSGAGELSPDGSKVLYSPLFRDFRHWKRYEGGWAQDLWIFDIETRASTQVTDHARTDRDPMWIGDTIYFASDRSGTLNLYSYDADSGATAQLTEETKWDVRWPSADAGSGRIVYELNGGLVIYDIAADSSRAVSITVPDDGLARRPSRISAQDTIEDFGLAPSGQRAVFAARGDIFTLPIEHGPTRNLTRSSGAHDREPSWSPDGSTIAYVSDADGEEEIYLVDQAGRGEHRQLTDGSQGRYYGMTWSPDSSSIAVQDQAGRLYVLDVESGDKTEVADDGQPFGLGYAWSPDGSYIALALSDTNGFRSLYLWQQATGELTRVTGEMWNEYSPTWGTDGNYLFYLSDREFAPQLGSYEFNYVLNRETYAYALALRKDVPHLFPPRSDEVEIEEADESADDGEDEEKEAKKGKKDKGKKKAEESDEAGDDASMKIDLDGLAQRVIRVPMPADNYFGIAAVPGHLLAFRGGAGYYGRAGEKPPEIATFGFESRELKPLAGGIFGVAQSPDGGKLLIRRGGGFELLAAEPGASGKPVSTAGLAVDRVPAEEWAQIFDEVWRRFRDFFYVENMHGYDWEALREQYRPWLEHVGHRSDLNYVMSEMIAELNVSHAYVTGGDYEIPDRPNAALLGARFELDGDHYRIARIFDGDNSEAGYRSPLTEVGVDAAVGDYVLAINGVELTADDNPYRLLRHAGGSSVELTLASSPSGDSRRVVVAPIGDEDPLLYLAWIRNNQKIVDERSGGRLGYIHIPDMGASGIREFIKHFYGQIRKEGLVIDVRSNGGGNVSPMVLERLGRKLLMMDWERNKDIPDTYPGVVFHGKMVCLLDEDTASDGDQFSYVFRKAGLGPLVGKRSWGGVVGIYGRAPLLDGGGLSVPEAGSGGLNGEWVIEGHGVEPDFVVDNDPAELLEGTDRQLEKAIEVVLDKLEAEPMPLPAKPADPDKT